jgi:predicted metal-dependent hydrolase
MFNQSHAKNPEGIEIQVRKVDFGLSDDAPYLWHDNSFLAHFLNFFSIYLPEGEQFFIDSVKPFRDRITDTVLQKKVSAFMAQEAMHSKQHNRFNQLLIQKNKNLMIVVKFSRFWDKVDRALPLRTQLAVTCAIEHFTALLANMVLSSDFAKSVEHNGDSFSHLWMWHLVEEIEHKSVCYEVYQTIFGGLFGYIERCLILLIATLCISISLTLSAVITSVFYQRPKIINREKTVNRPFFYDIMDRLIKPYFAYYRPFFHPWQQDNSHLVTEWKARYEKSVLVDGAS